MSGFSLSVLNALFREMKTSDSIAVCEQKIRKIRQAKQSKAKLFVSPTV